MALTERTLGLLVDLVENKMTSMQIADREDAREFVGLQRCLAELRSFRGSPTTQVVPTEIRRRGRPPKMRELASC
jgi:hypothetical protein